MSEGNTPLVISDPIDNTFGEFLLVFGQMKRGKNILMLCAVLFICNCEMGSKEQFVAPRAKGIGLASHAGAFWIIPGHTLHDKGRVMGTEENLLYILIVCPNLTPYESGRAIEFTRRSNTYISHWETKEGEVVVKVLWDKAADTVSIGKERFYRGKGNIFVVVREADGKLLSSQLSHPGADLDATDALRFIQERMKDEESVSKVRLVQRN